MAFDSPPYPMDGSTIDAELFRRAIGTLLSPAGGIVTPGDLAVAQQTVPNMSVQIGVGQVWIPGTSTATQGPYYSRNGAAVTQAINAADPSNPRIDTVGVQVVDVAYAGAAKTCAPFYVAGTPTAGATLVNLSGKGAVPASSLVLAYVLVPTSATSIVTADISAMIAPVCGRGTGAWTTITSLNTGISAGTPPPQVRLEGDVVRLRGVLQSSGALAVNFSWATLPSIFWPTNQPELEFAYPPNGLVGVISTAGQIKLGSSTSSAAGLGLDGLTYVLN